MTLSRKEFFKKACLTGACMCGFGSLVLSAKNSSGPSALSEDEDKRLTLVQEYLGGLLLNMQENLDEEENRKNIKQLAQVHYKQLNMDEFLKPYQNNLDGFISFIEKEWGWKITYNKSTQMIIADENKSYCVCPMINHKAGIKVAALCYCSEGFAETMFSKVIGHKVNAKVISSIQRGNDRCKYEISLS
jgi:hypothetical protein